MADEDEDKKTNGDVDPDADPDADGDDKGKDDKKTDPKEFLKKRAEDARVQEAEEAEQRAAEARTADSAKKYDIDLSGIEDDALRGSIEAALTDGKKMRTANVQLADYAIKQARSAAALEIAIELDMLDNVKDIEATLRGAKSPQELELAKREVRLELAGEQAESKKGKDGDKSRKGKGKGRQIDQGRGVGANRRTELLKKIEAIDPEDPEAEKKLNELYAEVQEAQTRSTKK